MAVDIAHYDIKIRGRVQGVGYRAFAAKSARTLNLKGFVKNLVDGSVLVEAEGPVDLLDRLVIDCKKGPGWARVEDVLVSEAPVVGYSDFNVRY